MALLEVKNLGISFGGLRAVNGFDISIEKEALYGLIGPNGAGKTTVFNLLTGVYKPDSGKVLLDGTDITGKNTIEINKAGIARTFQNIRLFKQLSVLDNVKVGLHKTDHVHQFPRLVRVHARSGLVEQQKLRFCRHRSGDLKPSLLSVRKIRGGNMRHIFQIEHFQKFHCLLIHLFFHFSVTGKS